MARIALVVLAGLGILGVFLPTFPNQPSLFDSAPHAQLYQVVGGFGLAFLAGLLGGGYGIARWSALIAAAACGFVTSVFWPHIHADIVDGGIGARLLMAGALGGLASAIAAAIWTPKE